MKRKIILISLLLIILFGAFAAGYATADGGYDYHCRSGEVCLVLLDSDTTMRIDCQDKNKRIMTGAVFVWRFDTFCNGLPR